MSGLTDPDGGFQIPEIISTQIESLVLRQSPIRQLAKVINLPGRVTRLPINVRGATGGWLAETAARTETTTPQFNEVTPTGGTIYAVPKVSEELVDDAVANIEQFVTDNVVDCLAEMESIAFIGGDGVNKPTGFLSGTPVATADASRAFGTLQYVASGNATTLGTTPNDTLIAMVLSMKAGYRQSPGCAWVMSTAALSVIAQLKDTQGRPLFIPSLREGIPGMLFGYPVVECEHMAAIGAGAFPIAFGNWQRGYVIGDRTQLSILRDPFTQKGFILWYFRRRTYGNILNSEAIKLLKVAVS
jgi:HK97 family phage major capsid protein